MHPSTLLALLATAAGTASAAGTLGFSLGDKNADSSCKTQDDYAADFKAIAAETTARIVRTYAASECNSSRYILPAAKAAGFQVVLGNWADTDESYANDKAAILQYAPQYPDQVYAVTVGSESLYREAFSGSELNDKITDMKSALTDAGITAKIGTADSWNKFQDGTADAIIEGGAVDILLCNAFSYWQGQNINNATGSFMDDIMQAFGRIQSLAGDTNIELWVGETGWTTDGDTYQSAVPSTSNAETFYSQAVCGLLNWGYNVFFFEAFDEPWKQPATGDDGSTADETHWGAMTVNRTLKYSLDC